MNWEMEPEKISILKNGKSRETKTSEQKEIKYCHELCRTWLKKKNRLLQVHENLRSRVGERCQFLSATKNFSDLLRGIKLQIEVVLQNTSIIKTEQQQQQKQKEAKQTCQRTSL